MIRHEYLKFFSLSKISPKNKHFEWNQNAGGGLMERKTSNNGSPAGLFPGYKNSLYIFSPVMKILITGSNGLLGQHLISQLAALQHEVIATGRGVPRFAPDQAVRYEDLDITNFRRMAAFIQSESPEVLLHSAAMTQVDECELNREKCRRVNVQSTENLLEAAAPCGTHFVFLSTDFVFDGIKGNYREEDAVGPVNWYGETKVLSEERVKNYPANWSIARTCLLYGVSRGSSRSNIISWIRSSLEKGERIRVVNDQVRTPTDVNDFATGLRLIIEQKASGLFHISGRERMTPYQLALETAGHFSLDKTLIEEVNADSFSQAGQRPLKTGFIIEKAEKVLGFSPVPLKTGLANMAFRKG
ncbi:MAG TPA: SDR family oxidoreductase [Puia sp.]